MKNFNKDIGALGENLAKNFLIGNGYTILDNNFTCKLGELDLIVQKKNIISFVEVKTRYYFNYGLPMESITFSKRKKIFLVSSYYIQKYNLKDYYFSYDIVEIFFNKYNNKYKINFIKDAFRI